MDVNTDVWGLPATWVDGSVIEQKANIKFAESSNDTYRELYVNDRLDLNTTDLSAAYWGIGAGSIFNMPHYLSPYQFDGETEVAVDKAADNISRPLILSNSIFSGSQYIRYSSRYSPLTVSPVGSTDMSYTGKIILSYTYPNIMLVPWIICKTAGYTSSTYSYSLYDYMTNARYTSYPEIINIKYQAYFGDGDSNRSSASLGIITNVNFKVYDVYYGSNNFWTQGGCSILINSTDRTQSCIGALNNTTTTINNLIGDSITALAYKYSKSSTTSVPVYYFDPDNDLWQINKTGAQSGVTKWYEYPYINVTADNADDVKDYILSQIAYLGMPFVYDPDNVSRGQIGDVGVYLPVFDNNGITTGEYREGIDAQRLPNAEWIDGREGAKYDPNITPQGDLDNSELSKTLYYSSNKYYVMNQTQLDTFLNTVNGLYTGGTTPEEKAEEIQDMQVQFKGSNPADYIVGLYGVPIDITRWGTTPSIPVVLGPVEIMDSTAAVQGITMSDILYPVLYFNSVDNIPGFGDFRDYTPYTTLELYVPYCGTVQLDPAMYIGHGVTLEGLLDIQTGEMCVRVLRDGITVTNTVTGNIYVSLPITSQAMGSYENNIHQLQMAAFNREFGLLTGAVTGGVSMGAAAGGEGEVGGGGMISPTAPISMAANMIQLPIAMADYDYRITHCQPSVAYTSACSPANNVQFYRRAKLFVKRPVMLSSYTTAEGKAAYAHTVGHACSIIGTITSSGISGFCQIGSIDLSGIPATVEEIQAIKQALNKGVYV